MVRSNFNDPFWSDGNGRDFLKWSGISEEELTTEIDTGLFYTADDRLDPLVEKWMQNGELKNIMKSLHGNDGDNVPADFLAFREEFCQTPNWVDFDLIEQACKLSERSGLNGLLVLRNFALLGGYTFANLTKPLVATGSLEKGAVHRLHNTLGFWVEVTRTGADAQQMRLATCLRTRIIHSASRLLIRDKFPDWNAEKYGAPINHADQIATSIAFTVYYLYALDRLSVSFSQREENGIFHLWKYITSLLGVPAELVPENRKDALNFFHSWTPYQAAPDEDAVRLAESLLKENTQVSILKLDFVRRKMGYVHRSIANYLIDSRIRENLKIPEARFYSIITNAIKLKNRIPIDGKKQQKQGNADQLSVLADYKKEAARR